VPRFLKDNGTSLYGIFEPLIGGEDGEYLFEVTDPGKVLMVRDRARDVAKRLRALEAPLTTMKFRNWHNPSMSEFDAIEWTEKNLDKAKKGTTEFDKMAFTAKEGFFDPTGVRVHGVTFDPSGEVILVIRAETDGKPWSTSYADSAEILAEEFCQTMLDLIESEGGATLVWSA
jgi:hypothetical protein